MHHLHGSLSEFWCDTCGSRYHGPLPDMPEPELERMPPHCECGGLIRPGIVWFGEQLPDEPWQAAVEAVATSDVLVVVGTSGIVYPAAGLPDVALARGAVVVEVNPEATPLSGSVTLTIREGASTALPRLLQELPALLARAIFTALRRSSPPGPAHDLLHRHRDPRPASSRCGVRSGWRSSHR